MCVRIRATSIGTLYIANSDQMFVVRMRTFHNEELKNLKHFVQSA